MRPLALLRPGNFLKAADTIYSIALTTSPQAFDVPSGAAFMQASMTQNFMLAIGSTSATWPAASSTAGSTLGELNPGMRFIGSTKDTTGFSIVGGAIGSGTICFYGPGG